MMLKEIVAVQVWMASRKKASKGQSLAEYGLILALIAVVCITALTALGGQIQNMLNGLSQTIGGVSTSS